MLAVFGERKVAQDTRLKGKIRRGIGRSAKQKCSRLIMMEFSSKGYCCRHGGEKRVGNSQVFDPERCPVHFFQTLFFYWPVIDGGLYSGYGKH